MGMILRVTVAVVAGDDFRNGERYKIGVRR